VETRVQAWIISSDICDGGSGTESGFSQRSSVFPLLIIIPPLTHTHLSTPYEDRMTAVDNKWQFKKFIFYMKMQSSLVNRIKWMCTITSSPLIFVHN
jgi:hypothetical protein